MGAEEDSSVFARQLRHAAVTPVTMTDSVKCMLDNYKSVVIIGKISPIDTVINITGPHRFIIKKIHTPVRARFNTLKEDV